MPEDPVADYLRTVDVDNSLRRQAWNAVHDAADVADLTARLKAVPVGNDVRRQLFDLYPHVAVDPRADAPYSALDTMPIVKAGIGAVKRAGQLAIGAGEVVAPVLRQIPGVKNYVATPEQFDAARTELVGEPTGTAEKVGGLATDVGAFMVPAAKITSVAEGLPIIQRLVSAGVTPARAAMAASAAEGVAQGAVAGGITKMSGGANTEAGLNAAVSAASPIASRALEIAAPKIIETAQKKMATLLSDALDNKGTKNLVKYAIKSGAQSTPEIDKAVDIVHDSAKELLDLPVNASWGKWQTMLASRGEAGRKMLGAALKSKFGDTRAATAPLERALDQLVDTSAQHLARVPSPTGGSVTLEPRVYDAALLKEVTALKDQIATYGGEISVRNLVDIKRVWDKTVFTLSLAGKVGADPEVLVATAKKEAAYAGANAIRQVLDTESPTISKLNEVVSHAIKLEDLVTRVAAAHPGMPEWVRTAASGIGGGAGAYAGMAATGGHPFLGANIGGALGATAVNLLSRAMESPLWRTLPSTTRQRLAEAIQRGEAGTVLKLVTPIVNATVAQPTAQ